MEKTTQEKEVLDYLRKIGSITSWEAIVEFGYGNATVIAKYVLKEGGESEQNND